MIQHRFTFPSEVKAIDFVERVTSKMRDVALMRDGCTVYVIDAAEPPRTEYLLQLARFSSATRARWS